MPYEEHFDWEHERSLFDRRGPGPAHPQCLPCKKQKDAFYADEEAKNAEVARLVAPETLIPIYLAKLQSPEFRERAETLIAKGPRYKKAFRGYYSKDTVVGFGFNLGRVPTDHGGFVRGDWSVSRDPIGSCLDEQRYVELRAKGLVVRKLPASDELARTLAAILRGDFTAQGT